METGGEIGGMAAEIVLIEKLHHKMGHILPEAMRHLVSEGAIEGIEIGKLTQLWSCNSCKYAKATWKPIKKVHETPCASEFGKEIDLD